MSLIEMFVRTAKQHAAKLVSGTIARRGLLGEHFHDDLFEHLRHIRHVLADGDGRSFDVQAGKLLGGVRIPVAAHTGHEDYTAGEVDLPQLPQAVAACRGRWLECDGALVQFHILTFLGKTWCGGDRPQWPDEKIIGLTRRVAEQGGVVTYDVPIQKNGLIPEPFVEQLRAIGRTLPASLS